MSKTTSKQSLYMFLIIWLFTAFFFIIESVGTITIFAVNIAFFVFALGAMVVLLFLQSDDAFYEPLRIKGLLFAIIVAAIMVIIASFLGTYFSQNIFGMSFVQPFSSTSISTLAISSPSGIVTDFLSDILFTFVMVATAEELLKLTAFAELRKRYGKNWWGKIVYVGVPVGLWSAFHAIQAYNNLLMLIPAFINGLILVGLLLYTKNFLAPIIAHGLYNSVIIFFQYYQGPAPVIPGTPFWPTWTASDLILIVLALLWAVFVIFPVFRSKK